MTFGIFLIGIVALVLLVLGIILVERQVQKSRFKRFFGVGISCDSKIIIKGIDLSLRQSDVCIADRKKALYDVEIRIERVSEKGSLYNLQKEIIKIGKELKVAYKLHRQKQKVAIRFGYSQGVKDTQDALRKENADDRLSYI